MGPFALDLHDKASKPAVVRAQIRAALDAAVDDDTEGAAVDEQRLRSARQTLARYAAHLHATNPAGLSYYSAHTSGLALAGVPELPVPSALPAAGTAPGLFERSVAPWPSCPTPRPWSTPDPGTRGGSSAPPDPTSWISTRSAPPARRPTGP